jgi:hypothetical protein
MALLGTACGNAPAQQSRSASVPGRLVVTRIDQTPGVKVSHEHMTVSGAAAVASLYRGLLALPRFPKGAISACPAAFPVSYQMVFLRSQHATLQARLTPSGCAAVQVAGESATRSAQGAGGQAWLTSLRTALHLAPCWFVGREQDSRSKCPGPR